MCDLLNILAGYPKKHKISIEAIADAMGVNHNSLENQLNPNHHYNFPVQSLIPFIRTCNNDFTILDHIETRLGRTAIALPAAHAEKIDAHSIAKFAKEAGEALSALSSSVLEGKICRDGARKCLSEVMDILQVSSGLAKRLQEIADR